MNQTQKNSVEIIHDLLTDSMTMPYIGEKISQLEHALQCGDLAINAGADDELILASFLHDIGHICVDNTAPRMDEFGVEKHESVGAEFLAQLGFSKRICELVKGHVDAKRYLAYRNSEYLGKLSPASLATLSFQGGPMPKEEAEKFEKSSLFKNILQLRAWDELGKVENKKSSPLDFFENLIDKHLSKQSMTINDPVL